MEFSDYISQNEGVNDGSLDANYYQHLPYLESMIAAKGYKLVPIALGYTSRMAIYSKKHRALAELPEGAAIAYPNDPVNTGHALLILQEAGLITLRPDVGTKATLRDVTANPRKLRFRELEGSIVARALDDVDAAVIYRASSRWPASSRNRRSTPKRTARCTPSAGSRGRTTPRIRAC